MSVGLSKTSMPKGPVLRLPNVLKEDAGTYICTASNGVGSMSADQIELRVLCKCTDKFAQSFEQQRVSRPTPRKYEQASLL